MPALCPPATVLLVVADRRDPAHERALVRYLRYEVGPYSGRYRHTLSSTPVNSAAGLARVPSTALDDVGEPGQLVLRPTKATIGAGGAPELRLQLLWAMLWRREPRLAERVIDPVYKPVHWLWERDVAIGYSAEDLERLGEVGRLRLQSAGVTRDDVLVVLPQAPPLAFWQLTLGARRGGVATLFPSESPVPLELGRLSPTVLAGTAAALEAALAACRAAGVTLPNMRTVIVAGERVDTERRAALSAAASPAAAAVVSWWAPPGVRSLWGECRSGATFHLVPAVDHVELVDGEIVWTPIAWKGTVVLRLRTGVGATLADERCPSCGSTAPRLEIAARRPARRRR